MLGKKSFFGQSPARLSFAYLDVLPEILKTLFSSDTNCLSHSTCFAR